MTTYSEFRSYDLDTPEGRLAAAEALGTAGYNRAMEAHFEKNTLETVNGYRLRYVQSRFGRLISVDGTGNAYAHVEDARRYAASIPAPAAKGGA